jgi:heme/copper-type cytochrome/quinol oxidase subunit 2
LEEDRVGKLRALATIVLVVVVVVVVVVVGVLFIVETHRASDATTTAVPPNR